MCECLHSVTAFADGAGGYYVSSYTSNVVQRIFTNGTVTAAGQPIPVVSSARGIYAVGPQSRTAAVGSFSGYAGDGNSVRPVDRCKQQCSVPRIDAFRPHTAATPRSAPDSTVNLLGWYNPLGCRFGKCCHSSSSSLTAGAGAHVANTSTVLASAGGSRAVCGSQCSATCRM